MPAVSRCASFCAAKKAELCFKMFHKTFKN